MRVIAAALDRHEGKTVGTQRKSQSASPCSHKEAMIDWKLYLRRTDSQVTNSLAALTSRERDEQNAQVRENREIMKRLINGCIFLAKCEMPFRGHDESHQSEDRGPYKEYLS